jgi:hypothetical protein
MSDPGPGAPAERSRWQRWHDDYADPGSVLSRRLAAVVARLRTAIDEAPAGPVRLVSACAGEGRDVVGALAGHPRAGDVSGRLVELDPANAAVAAASLTSAGLDGLEVAVADAGRTDAYVGAVPADIVLLCGIFGNVPDVDIENTVRLTPMLCAPGATVLWTRHRRAPDLTPAIQRWFDDSGFEEVAFDSGGEGSYALGVARLVGQPLPLDPGRVLFSFSG